MHYVYMIYSESHDVYYKGYTMNLVRRLEQHNNNESRYTSGKGPWDLVFAQVYGSESEAKRREQQLKRQNRKYLEWVLKQTYNIVDDFR